MYHGIYLGIRHNIQYDTELLPGFATPETRG